MSRMRGVCAVVGVRSSPHQPCLDGVNNPGWGPQRRGILSDLLKDPVRFPHGILARILTRETTRIFVFKLTCLRLFNRSAQFHAHRRSPVSWRAPGLIGVCAVTSVVRTDGCRHLLLRAEVTGTCGAQSQAQVKLQSGLSPGARSNPATPASTENSTGTSTAHCPLHTGERGIPLKTTEAGTPAEGSSSVWLFSAGVLEEEKDVLSGAFPGEIKFLALRPSPAHSGLVSLLLMEIAATRLERIIPLLFPPPQRLSPGDKRSLPASRVFKVTDVLFAWLSTANWLQELHILLLALTLASLKLQQVSTGGGLVWAVSDLAVRTRPVQAEQEMHSISHSDGESRFAKCRCPTVTPGCVSHARGRGAGD
ncbi:hypothetical protein GJAV_G00141580 [Gymnothorax javanicus]|nr:hypothetical protein GJAV_G00141580 [Gymnothorax javanicus]